MRILIVGCGRVGVGLAETIAADNHDIVVIDSASDSFERLGDDFPGEIVHGSGTDLEVLERARITEAGAVAALTAQNEINITVALLAQKHFGVGTVLARLSDPHRISIYESVGIRIICPTVTASMEAARIVSEIQA